MTMNDKTRSDIQPPLESLVKQGVVCELVEQELAGGYVGWGRWFEGGGGGGDDGRGVVYLHGIQSHGGWFLGSCAALRESGYGVLVPDRRGSGLNESERGHCNNAKQLLDDLDGWVDWLRENKKAAKVDLVAVSWSGKLALVYAAKHPEKVRSVVLVTPGLRARIDIGLKEKIAIGAQGILSPHKLHEIPLNDPKLFTANQGMLRFLENDPLKLTEASAAFFITSRYLDVTVPKILWKIAMPVYLFLAEQDRIIDNAATIELLRPILGPTESDAEPARIYAGAHHTLDFEPEPMGFFEDLVRVLR